MKNGPYELVVAPKDFPGKLYRLKYCYEHTLVWWKRHGVVPTQNEVIHHLNHRKRDNRICNLELKSRSDHNRDHVRGLPTIKMKCEFCSHEFERQAKNIIFKRKRGQRLFFCSKKCGAKMQQKLGGRLR